MTDEVVDLITEALKGLTTGQREIAAVLREMKEDITALNERLERLEAGLGAKRQSRRSPPKSPQ
jgi:uncharacterized small protein (DUF1192 family)